MRTKILIVAVLLGLVLTVGLPVYADLRRISDNRALVNLLNDHATKLDALAGDVEELDTAFKAVVTKLNADAGVTDTDYNGGGTLGVASVDSADTASR